MRHNINKKYFSRFLKRAGLSKRFSAIDAAKKL